MRLELTGKYRLRQEQEERGILIVDDEAVIREMFGRVLKGYRIFQADTAQKALEMLEHEDVDVVLTDVMMPGMNGIELLHRIKERQPNQVVIVMTGYTEKDIILQALRADADDFISKPFNLLQLKTTIEKVLEKRALKEQLVQLKKMDRLKSDFLGLISHKLKTPITTISLFIQNLARGIGDPEDPDFQRTMSMILEESEYLGSLIQDLLYYSDVILHEEEPQASQCKLDDLTREICADLHFPARKKELTLTCNLPEEFPEIFLDRQKITFTLRALLDNAIKFTPKGGSVTVTGQVHEHTVRILIADTGIGISREELPKVFEKFYQVDPSHTGQIRGFGMGLFYARQFLQDHGGNVVLESTLGEGTVAALILPYR